MVLDVGFLLLCSFAALSSAAGAFGMVQHQSTLRDNLRAHPVRHRILELLKEKPGANISAVCREAPTTWGAAQHHLKMLERAGLVLGVRQGTSHQFYRAEPGSERLIRQVAALRRGRVLEFARAVLATPGATQQEISARVGMSRKVIGTCVETLKAEGLLVVIARAKYRVYQPSPALVKLMARPDAQAMLNGGLSAAGPHGPN